MSVVRKLAAGTASVGLSVLLAGAAFAASGQYSASQRHYNVYSTDPNVVSEQFFMPPTYVDMLDMATSVYATITAYNQPNREQVRLCYTQPYASRYIACTDYQDVTDVAHIQGIGSFYELDSDGSSIYSRPYQNVSAKGNFTVQHRFPNGLQQPLRGDTGRDSIVVSYTRY